MFWLSIVELLVYTFGLCIIYMFKFSDFEALSLASFDRYLNIVYLSIWIVLVLLSINLIQHDTVDQNKIAVILLCSVMILTPWSTSL